MTQLLTSRSDKADALRLLSRILNRHVTVGLTPPQAALVAEHLRWLQSQPGDLRVNCKLETVPELSLTRVVLEYAFNPIPPNRQPS